MIRLIATDLDGTLLENGKVPVAVLDAILELKKAGYIFAVCSGRQYSNIRRLFLPVVDEIDYVCENGGVSFADNKMIDIHEFPRPVVEALAEDILAEGLNPLISSVNTTYVLSKNRNFSDDIFYRLRNTTTVIDSVKEITEPVIKMTGQIDQGLQPHLVRLQKKWSGILSVAAGGPTCADCTLADKRTGLEALLRLHGISAAETAAFGDSFNDESMLDWVGFPYIRATADPRMKKPGYLPFDNELEILQQLLSKIKG